MAKWLPKPTFKNVADMMRVARMMYGLPVKLDRGKSCPLGYDKIVEIDGELVAWPNDQAFVLLVQAKHFMKQSSTRKVAGWLDRELRKIKYDYSTLRNHEKRQKYGISHTAIDQLLKYRPPMDECVLELDERERIFRAEAESAVPRKRDDRPQDGIKADTESADSTEGST